AGLDELPPTPQPLVGPFSGFELLGTQTAARVGRLAMTGYDGDRVIGLPSVSARLRKLALFTAVDELGNYLLYERRLPFLRMLGKWLRPTNGEPPFEQPFLRDEVRSFAPSDFEDN